MTPKKLAFFCALCLVWVGVNAQTAGFLEDNLCALSVPSQEIAHGMTLSYDLNCECWGFTPTATEWRDVVCMQGMMLRERTVEDLIKPYCLEKIVYREQKLFLHELCKRCPEPTVLSEWQEIDCINGSPLMQQQIEGHRFEYTVQQCVPVKAVRLQVDKARGCSFTTTVFALRHSAIALGLGLLAIVFLYKLGKSRRFERWLKKLR